LEEADNLANVLDVQRRLQGYSGDLTKNERRCYIREGTLQVVTALKGTIGIKDTLKSKTGLNKMHVFVFSDVIIVTKPATLKGNQFQFEIDIIKVEIINHTDAPNGIKHVFEVKYSPENSIFILGETEEEKNSWKTCIQTLVYQFNKNRVFGVQLDYWEKENPDLKIPIVVELTINYLSKNGLRVEGLFRIPGSVQNIQDMKAQFDSGKKVALQSYIPHDVGGVLKQFLRDLPEPLLSFKLYEPIVAIAKEAEAGDLKNNLPKIKQTLSKLPQMNYRILRFLIQFLAEIALHADANKMTSTNLSIVFGPSLLRPKEETIVYSLEIPFVNIFTQNLISYHDKIFE